MRACVCVCVCVGVFFMDVVCVHNPMSVCVRWGGEGGQGRDGGRGE